MIVTGGRWPGLMPPKFVPGNMKVDLHFGENGRVWVRMDDMVHDDFWIEFNFHFDEEKQRHAELNTLAGG